MLRHARDRSPFLDKTAMFHFNLFISNSYSFDFLSWTRFETQNCMKFYGWTVVSRQSTLDVSLHNPFSPGKLRPSGICQIRCATSAGIFGKVGESIVHWFWKFLWIFKNPWQTKQQMRWQRESFYFADNLWYEDILQ